MSDHNRKSINQFSRVAWIIISFSVGLFILLIGYLILDLSFSYYSPDFSKGFLIGREAYFFSTPYYLAFYAHIISSPIVLLLGTIQLNKFLRMKYPRFHRTTGKVFMIMVLFFMAPSGLYMSFYSIGGWDSKSSFLLLSVLLWLFVFLAYRSARKKKFDNHERWIWRSYLLITSAVWLRLLVFLFASYSLVEPEKIYVYSAWLSWVPGLLVLESIFIINKKSRRRRITAG